MPSVSNETKSVRVAGWRQIFFSWRLSRRRRILISWYEQRIRRPGNQWILPFNTRKNEKNWIEAQNSKLLDVFTFINGNKKLLFSTSVEVKTNDCILPFHIYRRWWWSTRRHRSYRVLTFRGWNAFVRVFIFSLRIRQSYYFLIQFF